MPASKSAASSGSARDPKHARKKMNRRDLLKLGGATAVVATLPAAPVVAAPAAAPTVTFGIQRIAMGTYVVDMDELWTCMAAVGIALGSRETK